MLTGPEVMENDQKEFEAIIRSLEEAILIQNDNVAPENETNQLAWPLNNNSDDYIALNSDLPNNVSCSIPIDDDHNLIPHSNVPMHHYNEVVTETSIQDPNNAHHKYFYHETNPMDYHNQIYHSNVPVHHQSEMVTQATIQEANHAYHEYFYNETNDMDHQNQIPHSNVPVHHHSEVVTEISIQDHNNAHHETNHMDHHNQIPHSNVPVHHQSEMLTQATIQEANHAHHEYFYHETNHMDHHNHIPHSDIPMHHQCEVVTETPIQQANHAHQEYFYHQTNLMDQNQIFSSTPQHHSIPSKSSLPTPSIHQFDPQSVSNVPTNQPQQLNDQFNPQIPSSVPHQMPLSMNQFKQQNVPQMIPASIPTHSTPHNLPIYSIPPTHQWNGQNPSNGTLPYNPQPHHHEFSSDPWLFYGQQHTVNLQPSLIKSEAQINTNKGKFWSEDEHRRFLIGLLEYGKGNWQSISKIVKTRTTIQIASHAQKYFEHLNKARNGRITKTRPRRRRSILDITDPYAFP